MLIIISLIIFIMRLIFYLMLFFLYCLGGIFLYFKKLLLNDEIDLKPVFSLIFVIGILVVANNRQAYDRRCWVIYCNTPV